MTKQIAAITTVRNDALFLPKWIAHYGAAFGAQNLFVFLDGHDQPRPDCDGADQVNFIHLPHIAASRSTADKRRARVMSHHARALFYYFDIVLATDVDEFLVVDPDVNTPLAEYLSGLKHRVSVSGLGLDVVQHLDRETELDPDKPFLTQRHYAVISSRYTKPSTAFKPIIWGAGLHRIKHHGFSIDPNLYLFHFGMVDYKQATARKGTSQENPGWQGHQDRREAAFQVVRTTIPTDEKTAFPLARRQMRLFRPLYALNKPGKLRNPVIVSIPDRFRHLI